MVNRFISMFLFVLVVIIMIIAISHQGIQGFMTPLPKTPVTPQFQQHPIQIPSANVRYITPVPVVKIEECNIIKLGQSNIIKEECQDLLYIENKNRGVGIRTSPTLSEVASTLADVNIEFKKTVENQFFFDPTGRKFDSIGEKYSCKVFEEFIGRKAVLHLRPDWLKNPLTGRNLELDIYDPVTKIAIEYNGIQHYRHQPSMQDSIKDVNYQMYKDQVKLEKCRKEGVHLIVVPYTVDTMKYVNGRMKTVKMTEKEREIKLKNYILPQLQKIFLEKYGTITPSEVKFKDY